MPCDWASIRSPIMPVLCQVPFLPGALNSIMEPQQTAGALTIYDRTRSQPGFPKPEAIMMINRCRSLTLQSPRPEGGVSMSNKDDRDDASSSRPHKVTIMERRRRSDSMPLSVMTADGNGRNESHCHHARIYRCRTAPPRPSSMPSSRVKDPRSVCRSFLCKRKKQLTTTVCRDTPKPIAPPVVDYVSQVVELQNPVTPLWRLGPDPTYIDCPFCHNRAITRIVKARCCEHTCQSRLAGAVCHFVCICRTCMPCLAGRCKNCTIYCTSCGNKVALIPRDGPVRVLAPPDGPVQLLGPSGGQANATQVESKYTTQTNMGAREVNGKRG
ncbi:hypothetical protein GGR57DRAFT_35924 [Xylariaceae sp. FL1272]|nr:hypothetical protein GGR57DRAFT_35924 [Xylariaceae sp. FL1272]